MIVSRRWLEALLGRKLDAREAAERLVMLAAPVDDVRAVPAGLEKVIVAEVREVAQHPNADRLSVCQVATGTEVLEVVCGAPNVTAGKKYPFAAVGVTLPGGITLERRNIRGVASNGMLCSARELGLGQDQDGILELSTDAPPGTPLLDVLPDGDHQIDIDVTANRPDLLCHKGVARELAAALGAVAKLPVIPGAASTAFPPFRRTAREGRVDGVDVRLEDVEGCPRYIAAVVRGVTVRPSPEWLAARLRAIGQRPINNVVDATNYLLFEINQPFHAFDLARLRGPAVVVRRAKAGEPIVTLDGVPRKLTADMTAICDAERPTIVAGVMGSAESEVSEKTTDIVLECAYFQPTRIRRTRRALGISSESSYRFERGIDLLGMPDATRRAIEVIIAVAGGSVREAPVDLWPEPQQPRSVFLRPARVNHLLGVDVPRAAVERLLTSVGFVVSPKDDRLAVQVPGWRPDVTREVDLIEEVARLHGYDSFPDALHGYRPGSAPEAQGEQVKTAARRLLAGLGLLETRSLPFGAPDAPNAVAVKNPMAADEAHLRTRLLPGLIRAVEHNWRVRERDVRLFEVGTVFVPEAGEAVVREQVHVAGVLTGGRVPPHWSAGAKVPDMDLWDLKRCLELCVGLAAPSAGLQVAPGRAGWDVVRDGQRLGWAGRLEADAPNWAAPLLGFELVLEGRPAGPVQYRPVPMYPAVVYDLALVVPERATADQVRAVIERSSGPLLERLEVFDEFRGGDVPAGHRSLAWHLSFRDPGRTLRDDEVRPLVTRAVKALESELGVRQRAG
jgi:phenylalanyl-tRNA synthetase beta chain